MKNYQNFILFQYLKTYIEDIATQTVTFIKQFRPIGRQ